MVKIMAKKELIDISVMLRHETANAYLVADGRTEIKKGDTAPSELRVWVPKSQCELEIVGSNSAILTMPLWLALEKGFI
jgi:hypothetical protein